MILPKAEKTLNNFSHWRHFYETHTPIVLSMTSVVAYTKFGGFLKDFLNCLKWKKVTKMTKYRYLRSFTTLKIVLIFLNIISSINIGSGEKSLELIIFDNCNFWTTLRWAQFLSPLRIPPFQNDLSTWSILGKTDPNFAFPKLMLHNQSHGVLYCVCCGIFSLPYCRYTIVFWLYGKSEIGNIVQFTLSC